MAYFVRVTTEGGADPSIRRPSFPPFPPPPTPQYSPPPQSSYEWTVTGTGGLLSKKLPSKRDAVVLPSTLPGLNSMPLCCHCAQVPISICPNSLHSTAHHLVEHYYSLSHDQSWVTIFSFIVLSNAPRHYLHKVSCLLGLV